jgi:A/G-specific adenine glycosylase
MKGEDTEKATRNMTDWQHNLLKWYSANKRDMPWRNTKDAYKIWLSEVILQQTRVTQGWDYYLRFIEKYPTVKHLAAAPEQDVLKLWQGLGYYSRARNLHSAAKSIVANHKGQFPSEYMAIRALKGVGDYTAGAIASIAFNLPYPSVDGNVMRVYSRLFGISTPIDSTEGKRKLNEVVTELVPKQQPGEFNQALMELGALVCIPANPKCDTCPIQVACYAYMHKQTAQFPVKEGKTKQRKRYLNYIVVKSEGKVLMHLRTGKDIWQELHDFPVVETTNPVSETTFIKEKKWQEIIRITSPVILDISAERVHILSHQKLHARFYLIETAGTIKTLPKDCRWIAIKDIEKVAVPRLIEVYIRKKITG